MEAEEGGSADMTSLPIPEDDEDETPGTPEYDPQDIYSNPDDKNKECNNIRIKIIAGILVISAGVLAACMMSFAGPSPSPVPRRIPARYVNPESLGPEDRELLSDVRTSFVPTGSVALPPAPAGGSASDPDELRQSESVLTLRREVALANLKKLNDPTDSDSEESNYWILKITNYDEDKDESNSNETDYLTEERRSKRSAQEVNGTVSASFVRSLDETTNATVDLRYGEMTGMKWEPKEETKIFERSSSDDDIVDSKGTNSESEVLEIISDIEPLPVGFQSFWESQGNPESIRKTQADLMRQHMDLTADPCQDFYQYACGNWAPLNPIPADKAGFDTFEMLRENLDIVLRNLLSKNSLYLEKKPSDSPVNNFDGGNNLLHSELAEESKNIIYDKLVTQSPLPDLSISSIVDAHKIKDTNPLPTESITDVPANLEHLIPMKAKKIDLQTSEIDIKISKSELNPSKTTQKRRKRNSLKTKRELFDDVDITAEHKDELVESADDATVKAKYLYESCMNYDILEKRRHQPLLDLLESLGGWPLLKPEWNESNFDWLELMARLRLYNNDILISEWVGPDIKNSDENVIQFDQTTLGLPSRDYFIQPSNSIYLEAYKIFLTKTSVILGSTHENAAKTAEEMISFETKLAKITSTVEERRNVSELYLRLTVEKLTEKVPQINWQKYLTIVLNRTTSANETVVIFALKYVKDLVVLLGQTEKRTISNYLLWRFIRHRVNNLDDRFQEAKQRFYFILFGREQAPPRWKNCVTQVNSNMGMALGSMFVRKYFDENSKNDTLIMTKEIQESFRELLNLTSWIDDETKILAGDKVDAMTLRIGYPDFILNKEELNDRYREVSVHPDTYFENTLNILQHLTKTEQARLGQPVNKTLWNTAPAVVNAYYSRNKNQIMFPAGILQPPFYHRYFPRSLNYGGIGVVIGHEITHGFDDKGRLFDKFGNLHRWWHDLAIEMFHKRAQCLVDQYNHYSVSEVSMFLDGLNTQGENIADNGGIKQAFRAYQRWLHENGNVDETLPGLNATNTQLFFLNFAQVWCGAMRPEAMKNKLKTAVHSPGRFRVIGTLSNSEDFAKEFNCPAGSPMNPGVKCDVW